MNRTAERIREIVLSHLLYIRVCGEKNDETCPTHAKKKSLHSICLQIHADYVTSLRM